MHRYSFRFFTFCFAGVLLCSACAVKITPANTTQIHALSELLSDMDRSVPKEESLALSRDIFYKTRLLAKEFKMISPPQYHNFLVNIGLRDRGLCYHWADELYGYLSQQHYSSFTFHFVGANIGQYWTEHNALVVVARELQIKKGIVIDPWRNAGRLYFSKVKDDISYHWVHRPRRGCQQAFYSSMLAS